MISEPCSNRARSFHADLSRHYRKRFLCYFHRTRGGLLRRFYSPRESNAVCVRVCVVHGSMLLHLYDICTRVKTKMMCVTRHKQAHTAHRNFYDNCVYKHVLAAHAKRFTRRLHNRVSGRGREVKWIHFISSSTPSTPNNNREVFAHGQVHASTATFTIISPCTYMHFAHILGMHARTFHIILCRLHTPHANNRANRLITHIISLRNYSHHRRATTTVEVSPTGGPAAAI